eukprot:TRINITY_DN6773_c3_g1_i1.p1 TRINITY_DN6773_c3_g1~~TRINITY_DN6773_c3_g1_i1.p1  ORF type:complete len:798 (+),score=290.43 TRINITY_DN6773_c3_g1_i1:67-2394(+)
MSRSLDGAIPRKASDENPPVAVLISPQCKPELRPDLQVPLVHCRRRPRGTATGVPVGPEHYAARIIAGAATPEDYCEQDRQQRKELARRSAASRAGMVSALQHLVRTDQRLSSPRARQLWHSARIDDAGPFKELARQEPDLAGLLRLRDSRGRTPLHIAAKHGCLEVIGACLRLPPHRIRPSTVAAAAAAARASSPLRCSPREPLRIRSGSPGSGEDDPEPEADAAGAALLRSAQEAQVAFAEWRRTQAVTATAQCRTELGFTPFHYAVIGGNLRVVEHMLNYFSVIGVVECELYAETRAGDTPISLSREYQWNGITKILERAVQPFHKMRQVKLRRELQWQREEQMRRDEEAERQRRADEERRRLLEQRRKEEERRRAEREARRQRLEEEERQRQLAEMRRQRVKREKERMEAKQAEAVAEVARQRQEAEACERVVRESQSNQATLLTKLLAQQHQAEQERLAEWRAHEEQERLRRAELARQQAEEEAARTRHPALGLDLSDGANFRILGRRAWDCAKVVAVHAGGPAEAAGLRLGDEILEILGHRIRTLSDVRAALMDHGSAQPVRLLVRCKGDGSLHEVELQPGPSPELVKRTERLPLRAVGSIWSEDEVLAAAASIEATRRGDLPGAPVAGPWLPTGPVHRSTVPDAAFEFTTLPPSPRRGRRRRAAKTAQAAAAAVAVCACLLPQPQRWRRLSMDSEGEPRGDISPRSMSPPADGPAAAEEAGRAAPDRDRPWRLPPPPREGPELPPPARAWHPLHWRPSGNRRPAAAWG